MAIGRTVPTANTGIPAASQALLIENIVEGLAMDVMRRESFLGKISNTEALKKLENFGDQITFRVLNPPTVSPYTVNMDIVPETVTGNNFAITVDNAFYAYPTIDPIDIKEINLPLVSNLARMMADAHAENEYLTVIAGLITTIYGASTMSYEGQTPGTVAYNPTVPTFVSSTSKTNAAEYIIHQFLAARKAYNQMAIPRKGRYAIVNSDVEMILMMCDQFTYQINGEQNKKAIEDGDFGIRVAGFDIIVSDAIPTGPYGGQTNIAQCILGHQNGLGFIRQLMETEIGFKMQTKFSRGMRQLDVFGFGLSDSRYMGAMPLKVA
jgi:hypothetical protein